MSNYNRYFKEYVIENAEFEINSRYPAVLSDENILREVILISQGVSYNSIYYKLAKFKLEKEIEDVLQEGALKITNVCRRHPDGLEFHVDFSVYVKTIYSIAAYEYITDHVKHGHHLSFDDVKSNQESEHSAKNVSAIDKDKKLMEGLSLESRLEKELYSEEVLQLGQLLMDVLSKSNEYPHKIIAFCYSVIYPVFISAYVKQQMQLTQLIKDAMDFLYTDQEKNPDNVDGQKIADKFLDDVKTIFELFSDQQIDMRSFCISNVISTELKAIAKELQKEDKKKAAFYRKIDQLILQRADKKLCMERNSTILTECAKFLMRNCNITELSHKFEEFAGKINIFDYVFGWSQTYNMNLQKPFKAQTGEVRANTDGDIIFCEFFSQPFDENHFNPNRDYLGRNIRKFSLDIRKKLICTVIAEQNLLAEDFTRNVAPLLEAAYLKYNIK